MNTTSANPTSVLQQWSLERSELAAALAPRAVAITLTKHRSVSGIRWRGAFVVTAAEAVAGSDEVLVASARSEKRELVIACDLSTDAAVLRIAAEDQPDAPIASAAPAATAAANSRLNMKKNAAKLANMIGQLTVMNRWNRSCTNRRRMLWVMNCRPLALPMSLLWR